MIWTTAKLTDVSRRQTARPSRATGFSSGARARVRVAAGLAIGRAPKERPEPWPAPWPPRRPMAPRRALAWLRRQSWRPRVRAEVDDEIVEVLEPDRHPQQAGRDAALREGRVVELAVGCRRRVDDHREHAAQRSRQLGQRQSVDEGPSGVPAASSSKANIPLPARSWRAATSCWGWLGSDG